ncbi:MAG: hypothetical protein ACXIT4_01705 [Erythrobacter sp.]
MLERPDGSTATSFGWVLVVVGILAALVAGIAETTNVLIIAAAVANLGIGLGVLLLSLGYLVRAIWFLPGREITIIDPALQKCDFCDIDVLLPALPCSAVPTEELASISSEQIDSDNCRIILRQKGLLPE